MYVAIEGCCHGELDKIYETLQYIEDQEKIEIDLLLCCGDFQAVRNEADLSCMACPEKHKFMQDFWQYYAGKKTAPYLTIFIGGNHEASNYLQELPYGGWVAPNIYYLGYAGVVNYKGLRIGGISGIFKQHDYCKGHFEKPPYSEQTKRSVYHVRQMEVFRLKQLKHPIDIMMSHDWPNGVVYHGDKESLIQKKRFFQEDIEKHQLGSLPAWTLLTTLRPSYWFSGHLHVKFAAKVEHELDANNPDTNINKNTITRFLALDKCLPRRDFLQVLTMDTPDNAEGQLTYDAEWLAVLKQTNELMSTSHTSTLLPTSGLHEKWDYSVTNEHIDQIMKVMENNLKVPLNFYRDELSVFNPDASFQHKKAEFKINQQTTEFCAKLEINDPLMMLLQSEEGDTSFNVSSLTNEDDEMPSAIISNMSINPDEINLDDDEDDIETASAENEPKSDTSDVANKEENATPLSPLTSAEEDEKERQKDAHDFKTPTRLAAKFSLNLPLPQCSTPQTSSCSSKSDDDAMQQVLSADSFSPITSSDSDNSKRITSTFYGKRQSDSGSDLSEQDSGPTSVSRKFKRRNASFYVCQSDDDAS
ncbi:unnamed protein product [Clavelina lepadiformis]|uniref:Lariat debranching enzyme C-terminal domain-containing protein n=1 Tax=Clavelina lepadiformis TaxID=159417 RepID=A0ABP0FYB0_CLALP